MMTSCEFKENLGALVDGELSPTNKEKLLAHIAECPECEMEYLELMATKNAFKNLESSPNGALADRVMERISERSPQKKTPFLIRHMGLAASLAVIAFLFLYTKFIPEEKAALPDSKGNVTLMADKVQGESYFGNPADDNEDRVLPDLPTTDTYLDHTANEAMPESANPESETPKGTPPVKDSIIGGQTTLTYNFEAISSSNSLSPTTSILVVNATPSEVKPHITAYNTVVNSESCITVDISAPDLEKILLKNSIEVVSSLLYKESISTAIYFE